MKCIAATLAALAAFTSAGASATSFTMTTELNGDGIGFIDTDSMTRQGEIGTVMAYTVWKTDLDVPAAAQNSSTASKYAVSGIEVWFQCRTKHYSMVRMFLYDKHGSLAGSYDKPILVDQPVPPQTGAEDQFNYVCNGAPLTNRINKFNALETPLQMLIRATRATLNDPRYVP